MPLKYPSCSSLSACAAIYLHTISALSAWKSQGAINTKSLSLIHILRLILPRIRHVLIFPSVLLTMMLSPPTSFITRPSSSPFWGVTNSLRWDSLNTFLLPKSITPFYMTANVVKNVCVVILLSNFSKYQSRGNCMRRLWCRFFVKSIIECSEQNGFVAFAIESNIIWILFARYTY